MELSRVGNELNTPLMGLPKALGSVNLSLLKEFFVRCVYLINLTLTGKN